MIARIVYALCLIAPWSLLWLDSGLLFPYTTGKAWVFRSIIELAFALSLIGRVLFFRQENTKSQPPGIRYLHYALISFLLWTALSNVSGIDAYRSFWSNWERMGGLIDYLHWAMYLFCLFSVVNPRRSRILMHNLSAVIAVVCAMSLVDPAPRSISTLGNPIYLGNLAVAGLFISAYLLAGRGRLQGWKHGVIWIVQPGAMLIMVAALMSSASRGPVLSLAAGGLAAMVSIGLYYAIRRGRAVIAAFLIGLVAAASVLLWQWPAVQYSLKQSDTYLLQRLGRISMSDQTTADRLVNWRIALDASRAKPWLGWGQENYMIAFNTHYRPGVMDQAKLWFDRAHNAYLDVLVASGIPGLLLYFLMLGFPLYMVARHSTMNGLEKGFAIGALVALMAKNLVGFDTFSSTLIWISLLAVVIGLQTDGESTKPAAAHWRFGTALVSSVLLLVAVAGIYGLNIRNYQDNRRFATVMNKPLALRSEELGHILSQDDACLRYAQNAKLAVFDRVLDKAREENLNVRDAHTARRVFNRTDRLIRQALKQQPDNYRIKYNGALLYAHYGLLDRSVLMLEALTRSSPQRTVFWSTLAQLYAARGENGSALQARTVANKLNSKWEVNN